MTNFEKNLAKAQRKHPIRNWWSNNGYKVLRVFLFPIWIVFCINDKIREERIDSAVWSDEQATIILDKTLPNIFEYQDGAMWYSSEWRIWFYHQKGIRGKNKAFAYKYNFRIHDFLIDKYQIEGYEKTVDKTNYETWVKFEKRGLTNPLFLCYN